MAENSMAVYKIKIYDGTAGIEKNIGALSTDIKMKDGAILETVINGDENGKGGIWNSISELDREKASTDLASANNNGLMSADHWTKLENIKENANYFELEAATTSKLGGIKIGEGVSMKNEKLNLEIATPNKLGGVKIGNGLFTSGSDGLINLSIASPSQLGGIKLGSGLSVTGDGTVNVTLPIANAQDIGGVRIGDGIYNNNGTISVKVRDIGESNSSGHILVNLEGKPTQVKIAGWDDVQTASDMIKNGAFTKTMKAVASDGTAAIRNITYTNTDPGADTNYGDVNNGLLICVYE